MAKLSLSSITTGFASQEFLNTNFEAIQNELNNKVLYRTNPAGEANQMSNDLDMNGYSILNASQISQNTEQTLTDGATIAWDLSTEPEATVTLAGNRTLSNPTNQVAGGIYHLRVVQDGTGSRTLTYGSLYNFGTAGTPTLTTTAAAEDVLTFRSNGTDMQFLGIAKGF